VELDSENWPIQITRASSHPSTFIPRFPLLAVLMLMVHEFSCKWYVGCVKGSGLIKSG
jgi:hypothetical protein